ncbi:MAG: exosortase/archaeosortase family protein [Chloroflexota bacterium]|nr:exosortase/archaeosortase family protein [Chloroflexota bacterium]
MKQHPWQGAIWVGLTVFLLLGLTYVYLPTLTWLGGEWLGSGSFAGPVRDWSHGPLVLVLVSYLVWRRRGRLSLNRDPFAGLPVIMGAVGLYLTSVLLEAPYLSAYSLILTALGFLCLFCGRGAGFRLLIPLGLFALAVPFPATQWGITGFLAQVVAIASASLARLAGAPVYRSGQLITVGQDEYLVEPLCSGFNFIMALLALVMPLLCLRGASFKSLGGALLWAPALALAAKIALVSTILVLTPVVGQDVALRLYHGWVGITFFLGSLGAALIVINGMPRMSFMRSLPLPQLR